ncbi:hypothetical protein [Seohaeicola zhoushanensis]|uniref:Uncharacterized protein n=1 Tax=Seohaeicola zhoushanensis TaxID=1569283 RepID=A0A8J3M5R9_9RHOB|nr:hypothetical protein [Seohaeicola zhoushanensis]GHF37751.1 hypothetical protein GCM10017056_07130 [Seohaeicola zhoushanensis]
MPTPERPQQETQSTPLGIYDRPQAPSITGIEMVAIVLSALWLGGAFLFFALMPEGEGQGAGGQGFLITLLTIFMPVAMIWVAAIAARAQRVIREESARLQAAIDGIRQAYVAQAQRGAVGNDLSVAKKLDEIAASTRKAETALATFTTRRDRDHAPAPRPAAAAAEPAEDQGSLALGTPAEALAAPPSNDDFIRALNFPETAEDEVGFAALRRALRDRKTAQIIQASQDVLTLLSQDGIYMDDLRPDLARPDVWRQFAQGTRGRAVAALGGVRDRSSLALTAGRMKQDPIFRDAAHHFLRLFDRMIAAFEPSATDAEIQALAETRTARAFMLLGRVAGTFD